MRMININKCKYEESAIDSTTHYTIHYFTYPKDLSEVEFCSEENYGNVVMMCIALISTGHGEHILQMSPTIEDEEGLLDVDWRNLQESVNYTYNDVLTLLSKVYNKRKHQCKK